MKARNALIFSQLTRRAVNQSMMETVYGQGGALECRRLIEQVRQVGRTSRVDHLTV